MLAAAPTVLLVDDSADTLEMYAVGLVLAGYAPVTASDHSTALDRVKADHPAAVVTDLQFGAGGDGWDLVEDIKNDPTTRDIPVVLVTGRFDLSTALNAHRVGCAAVLMKPCLPEELTRVLDRLLTPAS
jgi:CheY-like chemotaxis protein